jgi:glycosyltransferase involved in cell wall biosynthesis
MSEGAGICLKLGAKMAVRKDTGPVTGESNLTIFQTLSQRWRQRRQDRAIASNITQSGLFDRAYYLKHNLDVAKAGIDPLSHYLRHGLREGRVPSPLFDPNAYLQANPDVAEAGLDPVMHYILHGRAEGRLAQSPHQLITSSGLFDPEYYRVVYLDVALSGQEPLQHFLDHGWKEKRRPSLDFDPFVYHACNPDLRDADIDPLLHYIRFGRAEGRRCRDSGGLTNRELPGAVTQIGSSCLFDHAFYLRECPAVRDAGVDPLFHYLVSGSPHYLDPSPTFSTSEYLLAHAEVHESGQNPLLHFLNSDDHARPSAELHCRRPEFPIWAERMAGVAYFQRFLFSFDPAGPPGNYVLDALAELVDRSPKLRVDLIEPDITIIIPVSGPMRFLLSCLDSLRRQSSRSSVEIIVAAVPSSEAAETRLLQTIPWIRYRQPQRGNGLVEATNDAVSVARGRFLVFLDGETRVAEGWLDELIGSFDLFPKAGLVGSKLFSDDGSPPGRMARNDSDKDDFHHPRYCFAHQADFVSRTSIAVSAEIWNRLAGFDCEIVDFASRLWAAGYEVWLQPLSQVVHYTVPCRPVVEPDRAANRKVLSRILVLDSVTPTPDQDAGSFFTFRVLKALQTLGHQITFVPKNYSYDKNYTNALQRIGVECLYSPHFKNITAVLDFRSDFDFVLAYRYHVLGPVYAEIRLRMPTARIIFDNVDLHFLREEREAVLRGSRRLKISSALTRATELELIAKVDCTSVHTKAESEIIKSYLPVGNIVEFPYVAEVHRSRVQFEDRHDILFLGGFLHMPNIDAVKTFAESVWPLLVQRLPEHARFVIVGASPPEAIQALAGSRILVTGYVEDLQRYLDSARVLVAPLRYGAGIKGKVIQSLCYGTPSVITSIAAEGIGLVSGRETIIADDGQDFAEQVLRIYSDRALWLSLQAAGYEFVETNFSWERCLALCAKVLDTADATWLARHDRALRKRLADLVSEI